MEEKYELIGAILGDGHVHTTANRITLTGSLEDFYYSELYMNPLIKSLYSVNVYIRKSKYKNSFCLVFESKEVMKDLLSYGLKRGAKDNLKMLRLASNEQLIPFLCGLFDTDGSLKFSKQSKDYNYYPRIQFAFKASDFSDQLGFLFERLGFNFGKWYCKRDNEYYYHISGADNLEKWNKMIGFSNPVHKSKYLFWKKEGFCVPRSSLDDRLKALSLKMTTFSYNLVTNSPVEYFVSAECTESSGQ